MGNAARKARKRDRHFLLGAVAENGPDSRRIAEEMAPGFRKSPRVGTPVPERAENQLNPHYDAARRKMTPNLTARARRRLAEYVERNEARS